MKKLFLCLLALSFSFHSSADGTDLLLGQDGADIDLTSTLTVQKQLNLDNPFLIQLYGSWRTAGVLSRKEEAWLGLIFDKKHEKALTYLEHINNPKLAQIKLGSELYLLYELGFFQNYFARYMEIGASSSFLKTEMGIALDQMVGKESSQLLLNYGFIFTKAQLEQLEKMKSIKARVNYSLQAFKALRDGRGALPWISKLGAKDVLRIRLSQSALLQFAREGKLAASAKLIKEVIEPYVETSTETEEIALYYVTLARLLYQAKAYDAAKQYYFAVPESSRYFVTARSEAIWVLLRQKDYSRAKGELASLKAKVLDDHFNPELHLVSSMGNVLMCQFTDAKEAFNRFIAANRQWIKKIDRELASDNPSMARLDNTLSNLDYVLISVNEEKDLMERTVKLKRYSDRLDRIKRAAQTSYIAEKRRQWENRKQNLADTIYKMKFVKVEFISRMREISLLRKDQFVDHVSNYQAADKKYNELHFPHDGNTWGDDLFKMSADVVNQCIKVFEQKAK